MIDADEQTEWNHIYQTRIGILCGPGLATREAKQIAAREAEEHIRDLQAQSSFKGILDAVGS